MNKIKEYLMKFIMSLPECPCWHFWNPLSGPIGGCILGLILSIIAISLYLKIHL